MSHTLKAPTLQERIDVITGLKRSVQHIAMLSKRAQEVIDPSTQIPRYESINKLLALLESEDFHMCPELKQKCNIPSILKAIFETPYFHFPPEYETKAEALYNKFEAVNWGAPTDLAAIDSDIDKDDAPGEFEDRPTPKKRRKSADIDKGPSVILHPPQDHLIWGTDGIMHGIALRRFTKTNRLSKILNPTYRLQKRTASVYGDNTLEVGEWFASFATARFRGAHGAWQAGIFGDRNKGAYSVVLSGLYEGLDQDNGETVFYSGSGSHDNTDPNDPGTPTSHTQTLDASRRTKNPVRVLRASRGASEWSPVEGVRYDGLYRVVGKDTPRNKKGGLYERFKLERLPGQLDLEKCKEKPTPEELLAYNKIVDGFGGYSLSSK